MKNKSLMIFLCSLLFVVISVEQADAQRRGQQREPVKPEEMAKNRTDEMKKIMTLSDEQVEKVAKVNLTYAKKLSDLRSKASGNRREMAETLRPINEDWDKELKVLVSEAQWEKWSEHVEKQRQNRRGRGRPN